MMDDRWYGDGWGWGWGSGWMMLMPLFWIALVAVIVWAVIQLTSDRDTHGQPRSDLPRNAPERPLDILDRRLASGEIDLDTYSRTRAQLEHSTPLP